MMDTAEEFMCVTGLADIEVAKRWLEAANFDFEVGVNMYFSSTGWGHVVFTNYVFFHFDSNSFCSFD